MVKRLYLSSISWEEGEKIRRNIPSLYAGQDTEVQGSDLLSHSSISASKADFHLKDSEVLSKCILLYAIIICSMNIYIIGKVEPNGSLIAPQCAGIYGCFHI